MNYALKKYNNQQKIGNKRLIDNITTAYLQLNNQYKSQFLVKIGQSISTVQTDDNHHFESQDSLSFLVTTKEAATPLIIRSTNSKIHFHPKIFFVLIEKSFFK